MPTQKDCIDTYIFAKDTNRPHLMARAFKADAALVMDVQTNEISFPANSHGLAAITHTLVSEFAQRYENVYTFCIGEPPSDPAKSIFKCYWLVCMSEKSTGFARVGYGHYEWSFTAGPTPLLEKFTITIKEMTSQPAEFTSPMLDWASRLPYPWCPINSLSETSSLSSVIADVIARLRHEAATPLS